MRVGRIVARLLPAVRKRELEESPTGTPEVEFARVETLLPRVLGARLERLLAYLREVGLYVVPEGELEGFARGVPGHGPTWVNGVLERGLHADGSLTGARDLVGALAESF